MGRDDFSLPNFLLLLASQKFILFGGKGGLSVRIKILFGLDASLQLRQISFQSIPNMLAIFFKIKSRNRLLARLAMK